MRLSSVRIVAGISCLLFGAAAWRVAPHTLTPTVEAQTSKPAIASSQSSAQLTTVSTSTKISIPEPKLVAASGTEIYTAKRGEAIPTIARHYLGKTIYLTSSELSDAIRSVNHKSDSSNILKANENIIIPGLLPAPYHGKNDLRSQGL